MCIDLTEDADDSIVDLTNVDTPITLRREPVSNPWQSPRRSPRRPVQLREEISDDDELPDLLPFLGGSKSPRYLT